MSRAELPGHHRTHAHGWRRLVWTSTAPCDIGTVIIKWGFAVYYAIIITRNPALALVTIEAPPYYGTSPLLKTFHIAWSEDTDSGQLAHVKNMSGLEGEVCKCASSRERVGVLCGAEHSP